MQNLPYIETVVAEVVAAKAAAAVAAEEAGVMAATVEAMGVVAVKADSEVDLKAAFPMLRVDRKPRRESMDTRILKRTSHATTPGNSLRACSANSLRPRT